MSPTPFKYLLFALLIFHFTIGKCQTIINNDTVAYFHRIEDQIAGKQFLAQIQFELQTLKQLAIRSRNDNLHARTLFDLMQIKDRRTEDTMYFRNSAFLDTLLSGNAISPRLRALLLIMHAQRLSKFNSPVRRTDHPGFRTRDLKFNYAALDDRQRDSIIARDLNAALKYNAAPAETRQYMWLSSAPEIFLFAARFEDLVLSERVNLIAIKHLSGQEEAAGYADWLPLSPGAFVSKMDSLAGHEHKYDNIIVAYQRWLSVHRQNEGIAMYLASLARKYIFLINPIDTVSRRQYVDVLTQGCRSDHPELKAHSVYQLCLIWNQDGNKYYDPDDEYSYRMSSKFEKQYQFCPAKALQLYLDNKELIGKYPSLDKVLSIMANNILVSGARVRMENFYLPKKAIPITVTYKNADSLFYRIVRIAVNESPNGPISTSTEKLLKREPVERGNFALPSPADRNSHAVYLKLPALNSGHYMLFFSHKPINGDGNDVKRLPFEVTSIAAINSDEKIFILDRQTGHPLVGAQVRSFKKLAYVSLVTADLKEPGDVNITEDVADSLSIIYKGDTTGYRFTANRPTFRNEAYDEDRFDSVDEFYDDNMHMEVFTDRSIYRPGQVVHFKAIFFTNDQTTGRRIIFNEKNLTAAVFHKILKKWAAERNDKLTLSDPFSKTIDSAVIKINEFGSSAGSFILPKSAATGSWSIDGNISSDRNDGDFRVEEYKRPTIELSIEKQKKMLLPGQPFQVKFKLRSFSGADLGNIPINYTIGSDGPAFSKKTGTWDIRNTSHGVLLHQTGYTNDKGELSVPINDTTFVNATIKDGLQWSIYYNISATAVDATGESTDADESLNVSSLPVNIKLGTTSVYDRQSPPVLNISTDNDIEGLSPHKVNIKIYKIGAATLKSDTKVTDQWYYPETDWNSWFPQMATTETKDEKILILDTMINTGNFEQLKLGKKLIPTGVYRIEGTCVENGRTIGKNEATFKVFDSKTGDVPVDDINYIPYNWVKPGDMITWYSSGRTDNYTIYQILYPGQKKDKVIQNVYQALYEKAGLRKWMLRIPKDATGPIELNRISVKDGELYKQSMTVYLDQRSEAAPNIIVEKYRKIMVPGANETFTLSVKTKNNNVAAEILTTLYDASLDKLEPHKWELPREDNWNRTLSTNWSYAINATSTAGNYLARPEPVSLTNFGVYSQYYGYNSLLQGKVAGLNIVNAAGLNEVVTTYQRVVRFETTGSSYTITAYRNIKDLTGLIQPLIILDGEVFKGDIKKLDLSTITEGAVLKGADAADLYGQQAAKGVLVLSSKGPIVFPSPPEPVVKVRKEFNETAFFFPQVHADTKGYYSFSFTMPETATEWNWKILSHTLNAKFTYLERKLQTQLNLMVQPNMPRVLYQDDKIKLQSRISNLDTIAVNGKATCKIEDAVTGQDITSQLTDAHEVSFKLDRKSSGAVAFLLYVPATQANPLKIVISAISGKMADAEEHIIPILSPRVFVRQSQPVRFNGDINKILTPSKLPADASMYGMSISIGQKPQASLIYALPWLANYSYDCAEQTFNKLRARVRALMAMRRDPMAQSAFKQVAALADSNKIKDAPLPDDVTEAAMPWLNIGNQTATQHRQLFNLLDTVKSKDIMTRLLERLYKLQQPDGGMAWFDGGKSDRYISDYVLAGYGQLRQLGWDPRKIDKGVLDRSIAELFKYVQKPITEISAQPYDMYQIYALSYWIKEYDLASSSDQSIRAVLADKWQHIDNKSLGEQALLIINTYRSTDAASPLYKKAQRQLESIRQLAIEDAGNGLRWKDISDVDGLSNSTEETMALLAEAFGLSGKYKEVRPGLVKWLLTTKEGEHWQTTKATAAAIDMLQNDKGSAFGETKAFTATIAGQNLTVSDGLLDGTPVAFTPVKNLPLTINLQQKGNEVNGALITYYFTDAAHLDTINKTIKISKEFYSYDDKKGWIKFTQDTKSKAGDRIQVKLSVETAAKLRYVHINDPRAAAFEPKDNNSGYQYDTGYGYYRSVRDTGMDLFFDIIPKGVSDITYELIVAHDGEFTSGPAKLICMYQPWLAAYSGTAKIITN